MSLRDYQATAVVKLREGARSHYCQILCSPTGSGKTIMSIELMKAVRERGSRAAFIVDRLTLVDNASEELTEAGIFHGVLQADNSSQKEAPIIVCSAQTIIRYPHQKLVEFLAQFDLVVIDECHIVFDKIAGALREIIRCQQESSSRTQSPSPQ